MHDFTPRAIKLLQADPGNPARRTQVLVSLAHVVRRVPTYYLESDGKRMVTAADVDDSNAPGLKRSFIVFDDLGGQFDSHTASDKAQTVLEQMWNESA